MKRNFKWLFSLVMALMFSFGASLASAADIDKRIYDEFKKKSDAARVSVILRLKSQVVFKNIPRNVNRSNYVKRALENHARVSQRSFVDYIKSLNKDITHESLWITNAIVVSCDRATLDLLSAREEIDSVWLNSTVKLIQPVDAAYQPGAKKASGNEWNIDLVNVAAVWEKYNLRGEGVLLGHIDTGCDGNHPDCKDKIYAFRDFISGNNAAPYDDQSHGTHTVGTILGGNASGKFIGAAPRATIAVAKVFDKNGSAKDDAILKAMQWIMDPDGNPNTPDTPRLVSNSWGSSQLSKTYWDVVYNWRAADIYPLFAAGNSGPSPKTVGTPGGFPHSVAVGASTNTDKIASFSSRGPVAWDGVTYIKPDVSAPGENIYSAMPGGKWASKSGTSMATPLVAGVIALLYQAKADLTIDEITQILETTGKDLGDPGKDNVFGSCRIDAYQAVTRVLNSGALALKVVSPDNNPLVAKVEINDNIKFETKGDGSAKTTLEAGTYKVKISCFGYISESFGITIEKDGSYNKTIVMNKAPLSNITGVVCDKVSGLPVAAMVHVVDSPVLPVQTDPKTGKFVISVPAGDYKLKAAAFKYKTEFLTASVSGAPVIVKFELQALPPVLLVADSSDAAKIAKYYKTAVESLKLTYTYHDVSAADAITSDLLIQYPLVIWFTGADSSKTLTEADQSALTAYLNAGGALLLTGQDIGYELKDKQFYTSMLSAKFIADSAKVKNLASASGFAEFEGFNAVLDGTDSANNQKYADVISFLSPAKLILNYQAADGTGKTGAALAVKTDVYRIVYLGFGFEGINGEAARCDFMKRALNFLMPGGDAKIKSLAAAEARLSLSRNENDIAAIAELECEKITAEVKKMKFEKLNSFVANFEKNPGAQIYKKMGAGLRSSLIHEVNADNASALKPVIEKLSALLNQ
jgi:subtilisin family serine protease